MSQVMRWVGVTALALVLALTGCGVAGSPTDEQPAASDSTPESIATAIDTVLDAGQSVDVSSSQSGLTSGWIIEITGDSDAPLTGDELRDILDAAWASAPNRPADLRVLQWSTAVGEPDAVDFSAAADELGVRWGVYRGGITILPGALAQLLGEWEPAS